MKLIDLVGIETFEVAALEILAAMNGHIEGYGALGTVLGNSGLARMFVSFIAAIFGF